jgi:hypothetical protein
MILLLIFQLHAAQAICPPACEVIPIGWYDPRRSRMPKGYWERRHNPCHGRRPCRAEG